MYTDDKDTIFFGKVRFILEIILGYARFLSFLWEVAFSHETCFFPFLSLYFVFIFHVFIICPVVWELFPMCWDVCPSLWDFPPSLCLPHAIWSFRAPVTPFVRPFRFVSPFLSVKIRLIMPFLSWNAKIFRLSRKKSCKSLAVARKVATFASAFGR